MEYKNEYYVDTDQLEYQKERYIDAISETMLGNKGVCRVHGGIQVI